MAHSAKRRTLDWRASRSCSAWALVGVCAAGFAALAVGVASGGPIRLDLSVLRWLDSTRSSWLTAGMRLVTHLGDGWTLALLVIAACCALWASGYRRAAIFVLCVSAGVGLVDNGLKLAFARERPDAALRMVCASGFAFPSGHATASTAVYAALAHVLSAQLHWWRPWAMAIAALLALTVGWSRAYLHVHYPSDVLGGWLLGLVWYATLRQLILPDSEHRSKSGDRGPCSAADTC